VTTTEDSVWWWVSQRTPLVGVGGFGFPNVDLQLAQGRAQGTL
jgi:hypothetical protein